MMSVDVSVRVSVRGSTMKLRVTLTKPPMGNVIWKRTIAWISFWYDKTIFFSCSSFVLGVYAGATFPFLFASVIIDTIEERTRRRIEDLGENILLHLREVATGVNYTWILFLFFFELFFLSSCWALFFSYKKSSDTKSTVISLRLGWSIKWKIKIKNKMKINSNHAIL